VQARLDEFMESLYRQSGLTSIQISELTAIPDRTVRQRLRARGVRMRTRGRLNREDRAAVPADALAELYVGVGLSAAETGRMLGVPGRVVLRTAHDQGLPVRVGGPEPRRGPTQIELVNALYADPLVQQAMSRYRLVRRPAGGADLAAVSGASAGQSRTRGGTLRRLRAGTAAHRASVRAASRDHPGAVARTRDRAEAGRRQVTLHAPVARWTAAHHERALRTLIR
jgi:hypothetical protein